MKTLKRASVFALLACVVSIHAWGQRLSIRELTSLSDKIKSRKDDTVKVHLLLKIGDHLLTRVPDPVATDSAELIFRNAESISRRIRYDSGVVAGIIGNARMRIAQRKARLGQNEIDSAGLHQIYAMYERAIAFVRSKGDDKKLGNLYLQLGNLTPSDHSYLSSRRVLFDSAAYCYYRAQERELESIAWRNSGFCFHEQAQLDSAANRYRRSIDSMEGRKRKNLSSVYSLLGNTYLFRDDTKRALELFQKAYDLAAEQDSTGRDFGLVNMFLGICYESLKELDPALKHYLKALKVYEPLEKTNAGDLIYAATNAAKILIDKKNPQASIDLLTRIKRAHPVISSHRGYFYVLNSKMNSYTAMKQYATAQLYCDSVLAILKDKSPSAAVGVYSGMIQLFIATRQFAQAERYLKLFREGSRAEKSKQSHAFDLQHRIDAARGNYKSALENYIRFKKLSDSLMNEAKVKELAQLNVSYETEKKEQSIALLKRDAAINKVQLREAELIRNGIIGAAVLLTIVLVLVFNLYRSKKKAGEALQTQKDAIALKNYELERLVNEKEWLLKEVHHRVKNNLHTIVSLLESQSVYLKNTEAQSALQDSQNRINAMSLIHQKLYQSENVTAINLDLYISELIHHLRQSLDVRGIRFDVALEVVALDVSQAIPVGLILNEAVTNSIKYAFPTRGSNIISINVEESDGVVRLIIADNGIGFPSHVNHERKGLGLQLIEGLTGDLKGTVKITSEGGVRIEISFEPYSRLESVIESEKIKASDSATTPLDSLEENHFIQPNIGISVK